MDPRERMNSLRVLCVMGGFQPCCCRWAGCGWRTAYITLSKMMTLLSSEPGDSEVRDFMSGAMYSR